MPSITGSITMAAPVSAVWDLMCDVWRYPDWVDPTDRVLSADAPPLRIGYTYREYGGVAPFKGESEWRITELEPTRRQRHIGDDGMVVTDLLIELEPRPEGTALTMTIAVHPRWFIAPLNAVLWPVMMKRRSELAVRKTLDAAAAALGGSG